MTPYEADPAASREGWPSRLSAAALTRLLDVTRKLAAPLDLVTMLSEVVSVAKSVLRADAGSVWLYDKDRDELIMQVATAMEPIRLPADRGIVGHCARTREIVNVHDCYTDPRFDRSVDRSTGYRTRCLLALPLIGHDGSLVGVLQLLNKMDGVFGDSDVDLAVALAAQCAVAIQRMQLIELMVLTQKLDREIAVAREIQMGTLPDEMPCLRGYDIAGMFRPTDQTGGDTFDFVRLDDERLMILVGDATGHGIGPALSATQVRAMLRVALRLGADLDAIFTHVNNQLAEDLPADRFVTAFVGILDAASHVVRFHSGGQGPILHYHAAENRCEWHPASTFPMGVMSRDEAGPPQTLYLAPGDLLGLISDGIFDYEDPRGERFGVRRVADVISEHRERSMLELVELLLRAAQAFGGDAPQADDITIVAVRRLPD